MAGQRRSTRAAVGWSLLTLQRRRACSIGVIQNSLSGHSEKGALIPRSWSETTVRRPTRCRVAADSSVHTIRTRFSEP
jgi:hypothetical protein